jgi:transposase
MSERNEFIEKSKAENVNISKLCQSYGISRKTGYKWIRRDKDEDLHGLVDRSRKPKTCPKKTNVQLATAILEVRYEHPYWDRRKIRRVQQNEGCTETPDR